MATVEKAIPPLVEGQRLSREEFMRRWEALPNVKFAELLGGIVYMPSPLSRPHGETDRNVSHWLGHYELHTPGCNGASNTTWLMPDEETPQPDQDLRIKPAFGGQSYDEDKYAAAAPEFLAEIWSSGKERRIKLKLQIYRDAGVTEYLSVFVKEQEVEWYYHSGRSFKVLKPGKDGIYRLCIFPGLWLDPKALLADDMARVLAVLNEGLATPEHAAFVAKLSSQRK